MTRNFSLGSRDMVFAGEIALKRSALLGEIGHTAVADISGRWGIFVTFAKQEGINRMEHIDGELVCKYGHGLAEEVESDEIAASRAQDLVSAVNSVMSRATKSRWQIISPTRDCGIPQRCRIREIPPVGIDRAELEIALESMRIAGTPRTASVAELSRKLGLRSREGSLLDARAALAEAITDRVITVRHGTKGGKIRVVPITSSTQVAALERAAKTQGNGRNLIPPGQSYKDWRYGELRVGREILKTAGFTGYHELRAAYACQRYHELSNQLAPVIARHVVDRVADKVARKTISTELGHGRIDVVAEYIGGRK